MQILGHLLTFLLGAQSGRGTRGSEQTQCAIKSGVDGTSSKKIAHGTVYKEGLGIAPTKADIQHAKHASNQNLTQFAVKQHKVIKLELAAGKVTVVMSDFSIFAAAESIIVWEDGFEKWDQSKNETAADDEHGVSRKALDYAWGKSNLLAFFFIVASDNMPVKKEVQDSFYEDHFEDSTVNIVFTETAKAVDLFNSERHEGRPATVMLSLGSHIRAKEPHATDQSEEESFGRAKAYPNIAFVSFSMAMSFVCTKYK